MGLHLLQPFVGGMRVVQVAAFAVAVTKCGTVTDVVMIKSDHNNYAREPYHWDMTVESMIATLQSFAVGCYYVWYGDRCCHDQSIEFKYMYFTKHQTYNVHVLETYEGGPTYFILT